jgi:hypothetical protein
MNPTTPNSSQGPRLTRFYGALQGSGGAYEISQRMTALVGWGATSGFADDWVYDGAHEVYVQVHAHPSPL